MKKRSFFLILLVNLLGGFAFADNLEINAISCKVTDAEKQKIIKILEYERNLYNQLFNTDRNDTITVKINLYGKSKDFNDQRGETYKAMKGSEGYFSQKTNQAYILKNSRFIEIIVHETSHQLLDANLKRAPTWLHEGLAEFFERFDIDTKGKIFFTPQSLRIAEMQNSVYGKDYQGIADFIKKNGNDFYGSEPQQSYSHAYSIIYFLIKQDADCIKRIISVLRSGKSSLEAIDAAYHGGVGRFEADYKYFYKSYTSVSN